MASKLEFLELLKNGLPAESDQPKHIVIVGAGMAGLTAGLMLKQPGHRVTLLEAQNRIGGRILTHRGSPARCTASSERCASARPRARPIPHP